MSDGKPDYVMIVLVVIVVGGIASLTTLVWYGMLQSQLFLQLLIGFLTLVVVTLMFVQLFRDRTESERSEKHFGVIEERLSLQPHLRVLFANHEERVTLAADWQTQESSGSAWWGSALHYTPMGKGNAPLQFIVHNIGDTHASNVRVFIDLREGCKVTEERGISALRLAPTFRAPSDTVAFDGDTQILLRMVELTHGLYYESNLVYVVFPHDETEYELPWTAHASNMDQPCEGVLIVELLSADDAPTDHSFWDSEM